MFAGGCFWGVQVVFQHVKGVSQSLSGQAGGSADTARHDDVSTGATDHAESVRIVYDPAQSAGARHRRAIGNPARAFSDRYRDEPMLVGR